MADPAVIRKKEEAAEAATAKARKIPNKKRKGISLGFQAVLIASAWTETLCDPIACQFDEDYSHLMQPAVPASLPPADQPSLEAALGARVARGQLKLFADCYTRQAELASFEHCILRTCFRHYTARFRGDLLAAQLQAKHLEYLKSNLRLARARTNTGWRRLLKTFSPKFREKLSVVTPKDIVETRRAIYAEGFPPEEVLVMRALGLSDYAIHVLRLLLQFIPVPQESSTFVDTIERVVEINDLDEDFRCSCCDPTPDGRKQR